MMRTWHIGHRLMLVTAVLTGALSGCGKVKQMVTGEKPAEEVVSPYTPDEQAKIDELRAVAAERFAIVKQAAPQYNRVLGAQKLIMERLNLDLQKLFPDGYSPDKIGTIAQAKSEAARRAAEAANLKFSAEMQAESERLAIQEHPHFKVGDPIRMVTVRGRILEGIIENMTPDTVTIAKTSLLKKDSQTPPPSSFELDQVKLLREHYVKLNYTLPKRNFTIAKAKELLPGVLNEFGFVLADNSWMRLDEYTEKYLKRDLDEMEADYNRKQNERIAFEVTEEMRKQGLLTGEEPPLFVDGLPYTLTAATAAVTEEP